MTVFSKYQDITSNDYFIVQQRKKNAPTGKGHRPPFRIITKGDYPYHEVAYGDKLEEIMNKEWGYIVHDLAKIEPKSTDRQKHFQWLVAHFTCLALETEQGYAPLADDDDDDETASEVSNHYIFLLVLASPFLDSPSPLS